MNLEQTVLKAIKQAEDYNDGSIVLQLHPNNKTIVTSWQLGNSWDSMGLNAIESQDRILYNFDCREYEPVYYEGEKKTKANRLNAQEQDNDMFFEIVTEIEGKINLIKGKQN